MIDLTAEQVRNELQQLIARYPNNDGGLPDVIEGKTCTYFIDQHGFPFDYMDSFAPVQQETRQFAQPVCIVGHWIHEFHPELKENSVIKELLIKNSLISSLHSRIDDSVIPYDVIEVLADAQTQQDLEDRTWKDIKFWEGENNG